MGLDTPTCQDLNVAYLRTVSSYDIVTVDGIKRDPRKVSALISAVGRNSATYVTNRRLQTDSAAFGAPIDPATIGTYLDALLRLWVVVEQPAWGGRLRSSAPARKAPKRHLVDPSLAAAAMGAGPDDLLRDQWAGVEVKLSQMPDVLDSAAAGLLGVSARMSSQPRFLAIVTADGTAYTRPDGVHVVPLGALCP